MAQDRFLPEAASLLEPLSPALGLAGHWYVLRPACRVDTEPVDVRVCGRTVRLWRGSAGGVMSDVASMHLAEADGYVWGFVGDGEPPAVPGLPSPQRSGCTQAMRTVRMPADFRLTLENSLDFAHSAFVHAWTQPSWLMHCLPGFPALTATYRATVDGLQVRASLGRLRLFDHEFTLPDRLRLVLLPGSRWSSDVIVHHVPETEQSCRMEVLVRRPAWPWETSAPRFHPGSLLLHRQDRLILAVQQQAISQGPIGEQHCLADSYTLLLRRVLAAAAVGQSLPEEAGQARTVSLRL